MSTNRITWLAVGLLLPVLCAAQAAELRIPSLVPLQRDAVESVDITLGPAALGFIRFLSHFAGDRDVHSAAARKVLGGLHTVQVHNFRFATDHAAAEAEDVAALRAQLTGPGWRRLVQVRKPGEGQNVDIYYVPAGEHTISEMTVLVAEPREFTLVHISGTIDLEEMATLRQTFVPPEPGAGQLALNPPTAKE